MEIGGKEGFKAFIIPKTQKLSMIKPNGKDPGIEKATKMENDTRLVGNDNSITFYKNGENEAHLICVLLLKPKSKKICLKYQKI